MLKPRPDTFFESAHILIDTCQLTALRARTDHSDVQRDQTRKPTRITGNFVSNRTEDDEKHRCHYLSSTRQSLYKIRNPAAISNVGPNRAVRSLVTFPHSLALVYP